MINTYYFKKTFSAAIPFFCFILALTSGAAAMQQPAATDRSQKEKQNTKAAIPDVTVYNQDGERLHFYSDLIKGKVVAINFIFTDCTYICSLQGAAFSKLQAALGDRLGRDVHLISISIDPIADTSERLKAWARKFGAKRGWTFVTGEKSEIDKLLESLTGGTGGRGEHSPVALISDGEGTWIRAYGLAEPERYIELFEQIKEDSKQIHLPPPAAHSSTLQLRRIGRQTYARCLATDTALMKLRLRPTNAYSGGLAYELSMLDDLAARY